MTSSSRHRFQPTRLFRAILFSEKFESKFWLFRNVRRRKRMRPFATPFCQICKESKLRVVAFLVILSGSALHRRREKIALLF